MSRMLHNIPSVVVFSIGVVTGGSVVSSAVVVISSVIISNRLHDTS